MAIYRRLNPDANLDNMYKVTEEMMLCCDKEVETHDYSIAIDTTAPENANIDKIGINGNAYAFSQAYDTTLAANTELIEDEIAAILESLGYVGRASVYLDGTDLIIQSAMSQASFDWAGYFQTFTKFRPNIVVYFLMDLFNFMAIPVPVAGTTLTLQKYEINSVVQDEQGSSQLFTGGGETKYENVFNWIETLLSALGVEFHYFTTDAFTFVAPTGIGNNPNDFDAATPFSIWVHRSDDNTVHKFELDDSGVFTHLIDAAAQIVAVNPESAVIPFV